MHCYVTSKDHHLLYCALLFEASSYISEDLFTGDEERKKDKEKSEWSH